MRVLVAVAHPDDEALLAGGTIAKHVAAGDEVVCAYVTDGVGARPDAPPPARALRRVEFEAACAVLGARPGNVPPVAEDLDNRLDGMPLLNLVRFWEGALDAYPAEVVYTHHPDDLNVDHTAVSRAVEIATRPWSAAGKGVRAVYRGEVPGSTRPGFAPTRYVALDGDARDKKLQALKCYASEAREFPHPRNWAVALDLMHVRGSQCGHHAAEGFVVLREVA